jgi:hypothetical protein
LATFILPAYAFARSFKTGAMAPQGTHQAAQQSSMTGKTLSITSAVNVLSVTTTG